MDAQGRRAIDLIAGAPGVRLKAIFSPEHGITGQVDDDVPHGRDVATGRADLEPLRLRPGGPSAAMLKDVNVLVFDIQDVGRPLLHVPDDARLRDGGGGTPRHAGGGARPPQSDHGRAWSRAR